MKMPFQATNVWMRLTAPHPSITSYEQRRQSILLSNFLLVVMTLDVLILALIIVDPVGSLALRQLTLATVLVGLPVVAALYYLNRLGKYRLSARLFIAALFVIVHATLSLQDVPLTLVYFDGVLLILASILLAPSDTLILAVGSVGWQVLIAVIAPKESMTSTSSAMIVSAGIAALVLVSVSHRTQVEDERRTESEALLANQNKSEQDTRRFQEQLRTLHEVGIELDSASSVDDLCRMAVELGRSRLGFDRLGIWLYEQNNTIARGTFGTDDYGNTLDERSLSIPIAEYGLTIEERKAGRGTGPYGVIGPLVTGEQQLILIDPDILASASGEVLGNGWCAQAALWDGNHPVGHISADNLINQRPVAPYQLDLLSLFGTTLGHLYTRKQAEDALRQSEQRYSVISGLISDYAFSCKVLPDGGFVAEWMTHEAYKRITGYQLTEIGSTYNLFHPDDVASAQQDVARVLGGEYVEGEYRIITKSGEVKWLRIIRQPEWDAAHEKVVRYYGAAEDITERKRAEEALRQREAAEREQRILAESLRDTAAALTSTLDPEMVMVRILENADHVVPHDRANILLIDGNNARVAYSRGWSSEEQAVLREYRLPLTAPGVGDLLTTNAPFFIPDTTAHPGWTNFSPIIHSYVGAPIRIRGEIIGFLDLISAQRNFFTQLHAERLQAFADQAAIAIENAQLYERLRERAVELEQRVADRTHDLQIAAEVSKQITTVLELDELLPHLVERLLAEFHLRDVSLYLLDEAHQEMRYKAGARTATAAGNLEAGRQGVGSPSGEPVPPPTVPDPGQIAMVANVPSLRADSASPVPMSEPSQLTLPLRAAEQLLGVLALNPAQVQGFSDADVRVLTSLAEQISIAVRNAQLFSEVHKARRESEMAQKAAEDANRVKSQFLANMSHELRTPLNAILNFTAFVADGVFGPVNDNQADALQQSVSSAKHLLSLINDILDLTKIEVGLMDLFIQQVDVNEALAAAVSVAKGLIKDKPVELTADIEENLPPIFGDTRRIRQIFLNLVSNAVKFTISGSISIIAHREQDNIHVAIRDTGIGIAPADQTVIFESFKQAQNDLPGIVGTGLGLPISKYFVEAHGGVLWLESEVGKGSTFHVVLPVRTEDEANAHRTPEQLDGAA